MNNAELLKQLSWDSVYGFHKMFDRCIEEVCDEDAILNVENRRMRKAIIDRASFRAVSDKLTVLSAKGSAV